MPDNLDTYRDGRYLRPARAACPDCGRDTVRSEAWASGRCDDCEAAAGDEEGPFPTLPAAPPAPDHDLLVLLAEEELIEAATTGASSDEVIRLQAAYVRAVEARNAAAGPPEVRALLREPADEAELLAYIAEEDEADASEADRAAAAFAQRDRDDAADAHDEGEHTAPQDGCPTCEGAPCPTPGHVRNGGPCLGH